MEEITFPPKAGGFPLMRFSEDLKWAHLFSGYVLKAVSEAIVFNSDTDFHIFVSGYALKDSVTKWVDFVLSICHTASSTSCRLVHIRNLTILNIYEFLSSFQWRQGSEELPQTRKRNKRRKNPN